MADVKYDPVVIQEFANSLYARARNILVVCVLVAGITGAAASVPVAHGSNSIIGVLVFALCVLVGVSIGRELGFKYKLAAQLALCQVQTEVNTRGAGAARAIA